MYTVSRPSAAVWGALVAVSAAGVGFAMAAGAKVPLPRPKPAVLGIGQPERNRNHSPAPRAQAARMGSEAYAQAGAGLGIGLAAHPGGLRPWGRAVVSIALRLADTEDRGLWPRQRNLCAGGHGKANAGGGNRHKRPPDSGGRPRNSVHSAS